MIDTSASQTLSFEVFPPKKEGEFEAVYRVLDELAALKPEFISVTYGAGGSRSKKTVDIASYIQNTLHINSIAHMTCVGNKKEDLLKVCGELKAAGIPSVLALRGDRPKDMSDEQYASRDFAHADELMRFLREHSSLHIAGACYPEKHPESATLEEDLRHVLGKQEAGAEFLITQLFFDNELFYRYLDKARQMGVTIPIYAGIMPITSASQIGTSITLSGSSVPKKLSDLIAKYGENADDMRKAGIEFAVEQIRDLKAHSETDGIHLYSMNRPKTTAEIVRAAV